MVARRVLITHNNFPGQFENLIRSMLASKVDVAYITHRKDAKFPGVRMEICEPHREPTKGVHPYASGFEKSIINSQAIAQKALEMRKTGYIPDVIIAHSGWGNAIVLKDVWPESKLIGYFEWYYHPNSRDIMATRDEPQDIQARAITRSRNAAILMDLANCERGICPTQFQKDQFPKKLQNALSVIHDGVDTGYYKPESGVKLSVPGLPLKGDEQIVTYVARGMEPYRGFPEFMAAAAKLQKISKDAHIVIVGTDRVAYGTSREDGKSYKDAALEEHDYDLDRLHFTGHQPRPNYLQILQASSVHTYLSVPFVLSWSMVEAMSAGCVVLGADNEPVREIITDGDNGLLVDPKNADAVAERLDYVLKNPEEMKAIRMRARQTVLEKYNAAQLVLKRRVLIDAVAAGLYEA